MEIDDCWFWLGHGAYFSPDYPECMFILGDEFNLWNRSDTWEVVSIFKPIWDYDPALVHEIGTILAPLGFGPVLGPVHMYNYRTPDFYLSSGQDYHGGYMAGQQHMWQATFDIDNEGAVFSHQPLRFDPADLVRNNLVLVFVVVVILYFIYTVGSQRRLLDGRSST